MSSGTENFLGTWKIVECIDISPFSKPDPEDIEGAIFVLQDNGEIRWELPETVDKNLPLFHCDCFEVVYTFVGVSVQIGAVAGHMFEFWVDRSVSRDMMRLTFENWCILNCQQITATQPQLDFSYSLLSAFTEGYFSDEILAPVVSYTGGDGSVKYNQKEFKLHSVILELSGTKLEELNEVPADVLEVLLHFLYSQSLPVSLTRQCAHRCIQHAPARMTDFMDLSRNYIHRKSLRNKIVKLVNKVHSCAEEMLGAFRHNNVTTPSRFCHVIKLALRHAAVAFIKLVEVCVLYGEEALKLSRDERLEILRYAKARLPIFLTQFVALLRCIKNDFSTVKPSDRNDIAAHVVPEIEILLEALCLLMRGAKDSCNEIWEKWSNRCQTSHNHSPDWNAYQAEGAASLLSNNPEKVEAHGEESSSKEKALANNLYNIFHERELLKLHSVHSQINAISAYLAQKKENFEEMAIASKIRCVSRNLEQLDEELPVFLLRLEEIMVAVDDRFQWKDFKFCLQLAISQVCQTIHRLREERETLQKFFLSLVDLVQSDEFYQSMLNLKLITKEKETVDKNEPKEAGDRGEDSTAQCNEEEQDVGHVLTNSHGIHSDISANDLNLVTNLCTPKKSKDSILAQNAEKLLDSKVHADMTFEICNESENLEIPSHRVIVAARCDWFRRALLSGMKESIQKRIVIHDCPVPVFQQFLRFIYTGQFGTDIPTEYLSELIALADRYEIDGLKLSCEHELALRHLDENSVIYLLSMADQYNARSLRRSCMEYIASNPGVMAKELFEELSPELQMEVYDITMWSKANRKVFSNTDELLTCPRYMLVPDSPSSSSSGTTSPSSSPRLHSPPLFAPGSTEDDLTAPIVNRPQQSFGASGGGHSHSHHSSSKQQRQCKHARSRHPFRNSQEGMGGENILELSTDLNASSASSSGGGMAGGNVRLVSSSSRSDQSGPCLDDASMSEGTHRNESSEAFYINPTTEGGEGRRRCGGGEP